ncbi:DUF4091 domain-containing protein [Niameybacter sp.]|uniref:DUF4091 domain-containing protein n=1 Tax=Niameybacter sp. TaxID=2033640 RepID=UPI002FC968BF
MNLNNVANLHCCLPWSDKWLEHITSYFKLAHYGRQNTVWCPNVADYEQDLDFYNTRITEGERVLVYTCLEPTGPYLNRLLDMERLRTVLFGWVASLYEVDGFLHWGSSFFKFNPYEQSCVCMNTEAYTNYNNDFQSQLPAGDCGIFYPHFSGAISCTRLEGHRIGFEDLELINYRFLYRKAYETLIKFHRLFSFY